MVCADNGLSLDTFGISILKTFSIFIWCPKNTCSDVTEIWSPLSIADKIEQRLFSLIIGNIVFWTLNFVQNVATQAFLMWFIFVFIEDILSYCVGLKVNCNVETVELSG